MLSRDYADDDGYATVTESSMRSGSVSESKSETAVCFLQGACH